MDPEAPPRASVRDEVLRWSRVALYATVALMALVPLVAVGVHAWRELTGIAELERIARRFEVDLPPDPATALPEPEPVPAWVYLAAEPQPDGALLLTLRPTGPASRVDPHTLTLGKEFADALRAWRREHPGAPLLVALEQDGISQAVPAALGARLRAALSGLDVPTTLLGEGD
jgi:hypothetical protein